MNYELLCLLGVALIFWLLALLAGFSESVPRRPRPDKCSQPGCYYSVTPASREYRLCADCWAELKQHEQSDWEALQKRIRH